MATDDDGGTGRGAARGSRGGDGEQISDSLKTFGAVLKVLREEARLTQEQLSPLVRYSPAYIAKIEQGRRFPPRELLDRSEDALGPIASKVLAAAAKSLRRKTGLASWFLEWAAIEEEALALYAYESRVIPGLLQPEPYIRALFDRHLPPLTETEAERQVTARLARQQLLVERPNTTFSFIIEQALLERGMGGPGVTAALVGHLLDISEYRNVELQVMPLRQEEHSGFEGEMYLAETADHNWVGYVEGHGTSRLINDPKSVSHMLQRYGKMRSQALSHQATVGLLEQMRGVP
ncbi:helix-turn-helix domain-containing protein [Streptomyces otsuchiensis]|uniref:helix-turn-helix domain-containing protein n=1 Tax=Streptomyces otsuchiensis TaxID=2681388 RepID=UPI0010315438|nr:helix-turn-helix transcriptional regulator [Streptomyces otsuchiensis]